MAPRRRCHEPYAARLAPAHRRRAGDVLRRPGERPAVAAATRPGRAPRGNTRPSRSAAVHRVAAADDGFLKGRLSLNVVAFDYASPAIALGTRWDLTWRVGVRLADVYFDSHVFGEFVDQRTSSHFVGAGPHAGIDLWYHFNLPGL